MNAQALPDDLDDALHQALLNAVGCELAFAATEAVCEVLASRRDALADMLQPVPPPDAYDWYRRSGRWPDPSEA